jgi:hypothetical protein
VDPTGNLRVTDEHPPFRYQLEARDNYLYIKVTGKMVNREEMLRYQGAIEKAMTPELGKRAMVDGRDAERPLIQLRAEMWTWMSETPCMHRIAIVANEERTTRRVARTAEMNRMVVSGFHTVEEAEEWLLRDVFDD